MKYYKLIVEIDETDMAEVEYIEGYVQQEANWMNDSGIYLVSINELTKGEANA